MTSTFADRAVSRLAGLVILCLAALGAACEEGTRPHPEPGGPGDVAGAGNTADPGQMMQPEMMEPSEPAPLGKLTTSDGVIRIMPIGDSTTRATCWRAGLWQRLNASFAGRFDFVGTIPKDNGCAPAGYDLDNQAYSSSLVTEIVARESEIRAPADAVVTHRMVEPGQLLAAGQTGMTLALTGRLYVRTFIPETKLGRVKHGQMAHVTVDAFPGKTFDAIVTEIAPDAEFTPKQVETREERVNLVYGAKVDLMEGWGVALVPGQPAEIIVKAAESVTAVASNAR